jgi:putative OPT family oligopeptide transporter
MKSHFSENQGRTPGDFRPYVPAESSIRETTVAAILLGLILAVVMCAANTYLGLKAGMTVSASIPAAVISMGILKGILRRGTILENNIVQTIASAGESLAAGIIFTVPALIIAGAWTDFKFWPTTLIAMLGGSLGILFMVPLRRALIVDEKELIFPEGIACAHVLKVGDKRGTAIWYVFSALLLGMVFKGMTSALALIKSTVEFATRLSRSLFYVGADVSAALVGVGYIVGFNISSLVFIGGALAWLVAIPIYVSVVGMPEGAPLDVAWDIWSTQIRYMGVGAMIVGGLWSIIKVAASMMRGVSEAVRGLRRAGSSGPLRTEDSLEPSKVAVGVAIVSILVFGLYVYLTGSASIGIVAGVAMIIASFFFVAVSSYIVGLVGSSNNPVSGMTICTVLFASGLLLVMGMSGSTGMVAALGVAGIVCCAACTAGDVSQDLKTGYLLGATPRRQQTMEVLGVFISAFAIAPVLTLLHKAYGIGTGTSESLAAPQASLFASIVRAMFTDRNLPWTMVLIGGLIGVALITLDEMLRNMKSGFRAYVMPVAVGIYLPLALSVPIFLGGIVKTVVARALASRGSEGVERAMHRGLLFSSGLIAGEALIGIVIAGIIYAGISLPVRIFQNDLVSVFFLVVMLVVLGLIAGLERRQLGSRTPTSP